MLNFNTKPYYDDFNEDKNFHRILFKPGVAVQARELTQAQSILQDQIGKFGKFVLSDGSIVSGGKFSLDKNAKSLRLKDTTGSLATDIEYFIGMYIVGVSSKIVSKIISTNVLSNIIIVKTEINPALDYNSGEDLKIFSSKDLAYQYINNPLIDNDYSCKLDIDIIIDFTGYGQQDSYLFNITSTSASSTTAVIEVGDIITTSIDGYLINYIVNEIGSNGKYYVDKQLTKAYDNTTIRLTKKASNVVLEVNFSEGVFFTNNTFVKSLAQSIVPNPNTKYPSCVVGFEVKESKVDYIDDQSLLDPAQGSYNYTAPGADRYKIYLNLISIPFVNGSADTTTLTTSTFIELLRIRNGEIVSDNTNPTLGGIQDILAKQMYDHAGSFIVSPFNITFNNSDFSDISTKINCTISAGRAYVYGYPFNASFPTNIVVNKAREIANTTTTQNIEPFYGNYIRISDVAGVLPNPSVGALVEFHSAVKGSTSNSTKLGTGFVRNIQNTTINEYRLYLYNLDISEQTLSSVKSVKGIGGIGGFLANSILESGLTIVRDSTKNTLLYKLNYVNPALITATGITKDIFANVNMTGSQVEIETGSSTEQFSSGNSTDTSLTDKNENFILVAKTTNGSYVAGEYMDLANVTILIAQYGDRYKATFTLKNGKTYSGPIDIKYSITYTSATAKTKTLVKNQISKVNATTLPKSIGFSDIVKFKGVFKTTATNPVYIGNWNGSEHYDVGNIVLYNDKFFVAMASNSSSTPGVGAQSPNWNPLIDTMQNYRVDNGQKEHMYDHGTISAISKEGTGTVFVLFDYYTHSDGEYISFKSYPLNYSEIPVQTINRIEYKLQDYIDFRPKRKDTSDGTSILYVSYKIPSSILGKTVSYTMSYYLGRIDKLVLTSDRKLSWVSGSSAYLNYVPPKDLPNAMTIATVQFDPYTASNKSIKINYTKHRRYTMDDIGSLDTRLQNVEYYTALSIGEKSTLSTNIVDEFGTRLKNGFIVDSFTNFNICDLTAYRYNTFSIDLETNSARPTTINETYQVESSVDIIDGEDVLLHNKHNNKLVAFNFEEQTIAAQYQATGIVKVNEFNSISYVGELFLDPQSYTFAKETAEHIIIDENTAAIMQASEVPGLLYNDWNLIYKGDELEKNSVSVNYNNNSYNISTKLVKEDPIDTIVSKITPKATSRDIHFKATGLAPLSRMFVYINNRLVSGYVTPDTNPQGFITGVMITNRGSGYPSSVTSTINITGRKTPTYTASFLTEVNTDNGSINDIYITNPGRGYSTGELHYLDITGTHTNTAIIEVSTIPNKGTDLYTDNSGTCSGTLTIPEDEILSFDAGALVVTVCDTPHYNIDKAISRAQANYYAKTTYFERTIHAIRQPYITKSLEPTTLPQLSQTPAIIVPNSISYLIGDETGYDSVKSGSYSIPVYLNQAPATGTTVTVSFDLNASEDCSANTTYTVDKTSLEFNSSNWSTPQTIKVSYNLGVRPEYTINGVKQYLDNNLPTYVEFYGSSIDPLFDYSGTAIPLKSWKIGGTAKGVSYTNLVPYKTFAKSKIDADEKTSVPFIELSPIRTCNVGGQSYITVTYGGGTDIGWWTDSLTTYPLTFTAIADNDNIIINRSEYTDFNTSNTTYGNVVTVQKGDHQIQAFKYWLYGNIQGASNVTVSITSTNSGWNSKHTTVLGYVGPALLEPDPDIVVHPHAEIKSSSGVVFDADRVTNSTGTTSVIGVSLSKAPTSSVSIKANSSILIGGGDIFNVSNNGITVESGNTVSFSPTTWNQVKTFIVTGTNKATNIVSEQVPYSVRLTATSSDSQFNNKIKTVNLVNTDYPDTHSEVTLSLPSGKQTTGNGTIIPIIVSLSKRPTTETVRVYLTSKDEISGGKIITPSLISGEANGTLEFNSTNYKPQSIYIQGAPLVLASKDVDYILTCVSKQWDTGTDAEITNSSWKNAFDTTLTNKVYNYSTKSVIYEDRTRKYDATFNGRNPEKDWMPIFTVLNAIAKIGLPKGQTVTTKHSKASNVSIVLTPQKGTNKLSCNVGLFFKSGIAGSDTTSSVTTSVSVKFDLQRSNNDCYISQSASMSANPENVGNAGSPRDPHLIKPSTTLDGVTSVEVEFIKKTPAAGMWIYGNYIITGFYIDTLTPGFTIHETDTVTSTTINYREDTYAPIGTAITDGPKTLASTTLPSQINISKNDIPVMVPNWKLNGETTQACIDCLNINTPNSKVYLLVEQNNPSAFPINSICLSSSQQTYRDEVVAKEKAKLNELIDIIIKKNLDNPSEYLGASLAYYNGKLATLGK